MVGSSGTALGFLRCAVAWFHLFRLEPHCEASSEIAHRCNAIFLTINVAIFFDQFGSGRYGGGPTVERALRLHIDDMMQWGRDRGAIVAAWCHRWAAK
jgi:hypothetical protein